MNLGSPALQHVTTGTSKPQPYNPTPLLRPVLAALRHSATSTPACTTTEIGTDPAPTGQLVRVATLEDVRHAHAIHLRGQHIGLRRRIQTFVVYNVAVTTDGRAE